MADAGVPPQLEALVSALPLLQDVAIFERAVELSLDAESGEDSELRELLAARGDQAFDEVLEGLRFLVRQVRGQQVTASQLQERLGPMGFSVGMLEVLVVDSNPAQPRESDAQDARAEDGAVAAPPVSDAGGEPGEEPAPPPPSGGGARRFSFGSAFSSVAAKAGELKAGLREGAESMSTGMTRLATEWGVSLDGRAEPPECPAVLLEPEPETLAGWEHRARALEKHWREAAAETQGLRARVAAQEAQLAATQAEADMAQAYAAQVAALQVRTHQIASSPARVHRERCVQLAQERLAQRGPSDSPRCCMRAGGGEHPGAERACDAAAAAAGGAGRGGRAGRDHQAPPGRAARHATAAPRRRVTEPR